MNRCKVLRFWFVVFFLPVTGCSNNATPSEPDPSSLLVNGFAAIEPSDPRVDALAVHSSGEFISVQLGMSTDKITSSVYRAKDGKAFSVFLNDDGLPGTAFTTGYTIVFENWTTSSVDIGIIGPDGNVNIHRGVQHGAGSGVAALTLSRGTITPAALSLGETLRVGAVALSTAGCAVAVVASAGIALPCTAAVVSALAATTAGMDPAISASTAAFSVAAAGIGCASLEPFACAALVAELAAAIVEKSEKEAKDNEARIANTRGGLRFGGVWENSPEDHYFLVTPTHAADVWVGESCFLHLSGRLVEAMGNIFTYRRNSDGVQVRFRYVLQNSGQILYVERLGDGREWWLNNTTLRQDDLLPKCDSSTSLRPSVETSMFAMP